MGKLISKSINKSRTLLTKVYDGSEGGEPNTTHWMFWCPACKELHFFRAGSKDCYNWDFDGNIESPTFYPSLRYLNASRCHMNVKKGVLEYCHDCPHDYKNKHVPLPRIPLDTLTSEGIDVQPCGCVNYEQPDISYGVWRSISKCDYHKANAGKGGLAHYAVMGCLTADGKHNPDHYVAEITEPLAAMGAPLSPWAEPSRAGRALEVGAGLCMYKPWLESLGYDYRAVEPDAEAAAWSCEHLGAFVYQETFETYIARHEPSPDLILAAHVVEHFYDAPGALRLFFAHLVPGGRLILVMPDDTDRMNPDHLWCFSPDALRSVLERAGFEGVKIAVRKRVAHENFIYASAWRPE